MLLGCFLFIAGGIGMDDTLLKIDEAVIRSTVNCQYGFRCLSGDTACLCEVKGSTSYDMLEIIPKTDIACSHRISLGKMHFCICPTRVEIYNRYRM